MKGTGMKITEKGRARKWLVAAGVLVAVAAAAGYIGIRTQASGGPADKTPDVSQPRAPSSDAVHTYKLVRTDMVRTILVTGELTAARSRDITAPETHGGFSNAVTFLAIEGAPIKQGERLVEFDPSALLSQKAEAERRLEEAKLRIDKTRADLEASKADLLADVAQADGNMKVAELYAKIPKDLLPANTYQKYQVDVEKAKLAQDKAKERLANLEATTPAQMALAEVERAQAEIDLKKIDGDIAMLSIDAPQDGIVIYGDNWASNRKVQVGDSMFPRQVVVTIPDLLSIQVVALVYDTELPFLSVGMKCDFHLDSIPGRSWTGRILSLTSVANRKGFASQHKVFRAVIQPDKVEPELWKPGMTGRVEIPVSMGPSLLTIPREFLGLAVDGSYFVKKGTDPKTAKIEKLEVGAFNDRLVQVTSGLNEGDIILDPHATTEAKK